MANIPVSTPYTVNIPRVTSKRGTTRVDFKQNSDNTTPSVPNKSLGKKMSVVSKKAAQYGA